MATARAEEICEGGVCMECLLGENNFTANYGVVCPRCREECSASCFGIEPEEEFHSDLHPYRRDCWSYAEQELQIEDEYTVNDITSNIEETSTDYMHSEWRHPENLVEINDDDVSSIKEVNAIPGYDDNCLLIVEKQTERYSRGDRCNRSEIILRSKSDVPKDEDNRFLIIPENNSMKSSQRRDLALDNFKKAPFSKSFEKEKPDPKLNQSYPLSKQKTRVTINGNNTCRLIDSAYTSTSKNTLFQNKTEKSSMRYFLKPRSENGRSVQSDSDFQHEHLHVGRTPESSLPEVDVMQNIKSSYYQFYNEIITYPSAKEVVQRQTVYGTEDSGNPITTFDVNEQLKHLTDNVLQRKDTNSKETIEEERESTRRKPDLHQAQSFSCSTKHTDPEPIVMKLLRKQQENIKLKTESHKLQTPQENTLSINSQPIAMRILQKAKEYKEEVKNAQHDKVSKQRRCDPLVNDSFHGALNTIVQNMFHKKTDKQPDFPASLPKSIDRLTYISPPLPNTKLVKPRNKNICSKTAKREGKYGARQESREQMKDPADKKNWDNTNEQTNSTVPASSNDVTSKIFQIESEEALNIAADERHSAFQMLKQSKLKIKCSSCGWPECENNYGKKMTEIIKVSKQVGFEVNDVSSDGNCMFTAVVDQLQAHGDNSFKPKSLRDAAVSWLIENPYNSDGTPFASFVSCNWNVYLQKMIVEGEWGDHLTLRAIVEVLGLTIKVLSVKNGKPKWTILKPTTIEESKQGTELVLGHIAEFHYTSLRLATDNSSMFDQSVTEQDIPVTVDTEQTAVIDTDIVKMFRGDYIDPLSDMPSGHFSYLLTRAAPTTILDSAAVFQSQHLDCFGNPDLFKVYDIATGIPFDLDHELGGSVAEGVYVPQLNTLDRLATASGNVTTYVYGVMKEYIVTMHNSGNGNEKGKVYCVLDTFGVHTGYTRLKLLQFHVLTGLWLSQVTLKDEPHHYICRKNCTKAHIHLKQILAIRCKIWPECAQSWILRKRTEGWPSRDMVETIVSEGCLLVPCAHRESMNPKYEWQFSFTLCEKILFRDATSSYQKYCFIVFEAMCTQTMNNLEFITSAHRKSVFFYACERIPEEYWESYPGACVMYMLDMLYCCILAKNLPNYFIISNNMIADLHENDFKDTEEKIIILRSQPVLFLQEMNDRLRMLPYGTTIIDRIIKDIEKFKQHRSLRRSTLESFIPATLQTVRHYITERWFRQAFELLSRAFQDRLSVSTCDDSLSFQAFIPIAIKGLDLDSLVWFSAYTEKQLEGQLSKSLIRETCGNLKLVKISDILPADVVESYGNTEIPAKFSLKPCKFCNDFAKFLFQTNKLSEILPVLYYCHDIFTRILDNKRNKNDGATNKERPITNDFTDQSMFNIYTAMFVVYKKQHQLEFFRHVMPVVEGIVRRMNTKGAYSCLCFMNQDLGDIDALNTSSIIYGMLPIDKQEHVFVNAFLYWPH